MITVTEMPESITNNLKNQQSLEKPEGINFTPTYIQALKASINTPLFIHPIFAHVYYTNQKQENSEQKVEALAKTLWLVFNQHKNLADRLIETDPKKLYIIGNSRIDYNLEDIFLFGINTIDPKKISGFNYAGKILQNIRTELLKQPAPIIFIPKQEEPKKAIPPQEIPMPDDLAKSDVKKTKSYNNYLNLAKSGLAKSWNDINNSIRFYREGENYFKFTNFYPTPVIIDGKQWPTTEHYFQAMKFEDKETQEQVRLLETPGKALEFVEGKPVPSNWHTELKFKVMLKAVWNKFAQNNDLQELLLATGDKVLVENAGSNDAEWGNGPDGKGSNYLGRILMLVRAALGGKTLDNQFMSEKEIEALKKEQQLLQKVDAEAKLAITPIKPGDNQPKSSSTPTKRFSMFFNFINRTKTGANSLWSWFWGGIKLRWQRLQNRWY